MFSRARTGSAEEIAAAVDASDTVRCIRLEDEALDATILGNFGLSPQTAILQVGPTTGACGVSESGTWHNVFENDTLQVSAPRQVRLRPGEFRIYPSQPQPAPPMGLVPNAPTSRVTVPDLSAATKYEFGATGIDLVVRGTSSARAVTVERLDEAPLNVGSIGEGTISEYRFVVEVDEALDFSAQTKLRIDIATPAGIDDASTVTAYRRPSEDGGSFTVLPTSYDNEANELVTETGEPGEFVLTSNTEPPLMKLADLSAAAGDAVELTWRTSPDATPARFLVHRHVGTKDSGNGDD